ncbi:MAG TPA: Ig-like domain-containing protein [Saprospiraceae bacterium]|nr:Ig-like domain-containing protein [Saprospiraceae bacterium]
MKRFRLPLFFLVSLLCWSSVINAQDSIRYAILQNTMDPLRLTAVAYPNFTSNNVTISTAVFTFYVPAGTVLSPAIPVLPATGVFTDITGSWRIEKITPALYATTGNPASDLLGNDVYQCVLQNSPTPITTSGQPIQLFTFRVPSDCMNGAIQVHTNNNSIRQALLNAFGININNQMSVSVNDAISTDIYKGNITNPALYNCPLDDVPDAVDDMVSVNEDNSILVNVTGNDDFGNNIPATGPIVITTPPAVGTATVNNNGTPNDPTDDQINYVPPANFNGTVTLNYQICDADGDCDIALVTIVVAPVNDAPTVPNSTAPVNEDTPFSFCLPITDVDNTTFTVTSVCLPDIGVISNLTNPATTQYCLTYTPNPNANGPDTLCIQVCDGNGGCDTSTVVINVLPVNDPPVALNDNVSTPEDMATTFSITANDTDVDGTIDLTSVDLNPGLAGIQTSVTVAGGTFVYNADGTVTFTPNANFNGTATTNYNVCDTGTPTPVQCAQATITVTVNAVNDAPDAMNDTYPLTEDGVLTGNVSTNDTDPDGPMTIITVVTPPANGTLVLNPNGTFTYTPNANFNGPDTYTYSYCDGGTPNQCDQATVTINVAPVNDPPVANNDSQSTPEDMATTFNITGNDTDVDGTIDLTSVDLNPGLAGIQTSVTVAGGTFVYNGNGTVTFTPNANFNGTATTPYNVCDTGTPMPVQCAQATITVTVNAVNDAPDAVNDPVTTNEDAPVTFNATANDTDVDGAIDPATFDLDPVTPGIQTTFTVPGGTFAYNGGGSVTFTPNSNFNGTATVNYQVCDTGTPTPAQCDQATITVTVNAVNDPPVANNDSQTTPEDMATTFNITANDTDVDGTIDLTSVDLNPGLAGIQTSVTVAGGTFVYNGDGTVTFTPNANFNGTATTNYNVCDTGTPTPVQCAQATITVTVNGVNDAPDAIPDTYPLTEDNVLTGNVSTNDTDPDGPMTIITVVTPPANGMLVLNPDGTFTYTPNPNFNGPDSFTYSYCDGGTPNQCDQATVTINVAPVNDPPVANNDSQSTPEDMSTTFNITGNDTDVDGTIDPATVDLNPGLAGIQTSVTVAGGTFVYNGNGTVTFTPNANFNGTATTPYNVCDTGTPMPVQCAQATITVTVNAVNDAPDAVNDPVTTNEDAPVTFNATANDTDVDGTIDPATFDLDPVTPGIQTTFTVPGGTFTYNGGGSVTFTPNSNFNGTATVNYQVCDTGTPTPAQCDQATITVTVNAVNDPPVANNDTQTTPEDMATTFSITGNDTDTDGTIDLASVDLNPGLAGIQTSVTVAGGTFVYNGNGTVTFTPNANFFGTATTNYNVCDTGTPTPVLCAQATITVAVNSVNDAPNAVNDVVTINEDTPTPINVPANDTDVEGLNLGSVTIVTGPANGSVSVNNVTGVVTYTPNANFVGTDMFTYSICDNGTPILCDQATVTVTVNATSVRLLAKMRLQGALFGTNGMLMRDTLRQLNRLPSVEPYSAMPGFVHVGNPGGETVGNTAVVFANNGANSIVDWVFVELRSSSNPATVVKTRSALLQRDGDVVDIDGVSPLVFENTLPGSFYVSVRHRNHLGTMTAASAALTNAGTVVDFTSLAAALWDDGTGLNGFEQATVAGAFALWAGNVNVDKSVIYAGQDNDKNTAFNQVDQAPGNAVLHSQLYIYNGYFTGDVNMDGSAIFAGQKNDMDFIFNNVDSHAKNILRSQTYVIRQQLAE